MGHIVLLGDSTFDNASYVPDRPAVSSIEPSMIGGGKIARLITEVATGQASVPGSMVFF